MTYLFTSYCKKNIIPKVHGTIEHSRIPKPLHVLRQVQDTTQSGLQRSKVHRQEVVVEDKSGSANKREIGKQTHVSSMHQISYQSRLQWCHQLAVYAHASHILHPDTGAQKQHRQA